jgi:hypothetical protein
MREHQYHWTTRTKESRAGFGLYMEGKKWTPLFEKTESFPERIMASTANVPRSDLATLNHVRGFVKSDSRPF